MKKRAIISVSNKKNLSTICKSLEKYNIEIIATGNTYKAIYKLGFKIITIQQSQNIVILSLLFLVTVLICRLFIRTVQKQLLKLNIGLRNTVIIGSNDNGCKFLESISENKYLGYKILAYFDSLDSQKKKNELKKLINKKSINNSRLSNCYIGFLDEIEPFIINNKINEVIIALSKNNDDDLLNIITKLNKYMTIKILYCFSKMKFNIFVVF